MPVISSSSLALTYRRAFENESKRRIENRVLPETNRRVQNFQCSIVLGFRLGNAQLAVSVLNWVFCCSLWEGQRNGGDVAFDRLPGGGIHFGWIFPPTPEGGIAEALLF